VYNNDSFFEGVSRWGTGDCTAIGSNGEPFFLNESGGVWGAPT
jgi:hypothetical protein